MQKQTAVRAILPMIGMLTIGIGIGRAFAPGTNLYMSGGLASRRVLQYDGTAYAPLADIARALNQTVVPRPDGYAIAPAGGANQVSGTNGTVGDKLTNGQITLTVVKVIRTDHYTKQFDTGDAKPDSPNDDLVVVVCRIKNAIPKSFTLQTAGGDNTALTDQDSHTYHPSRFNSDIREPSPTILPGSAIDFALGFAVPKNEKLGDLVYQVSGGGGAVVKDTNFRISLAAENP